MIWRTDNPTEDVIVAQLVETWQSRYELLYLADKPYIHYYDESGEEVPFSAIAKWASLQDEQAEKDLALTKADIERIHVFLYAVKNNKQGCFTFQKLKDEQYQEVLDKFNNAKDYDTEQNTD